MLGFANSTFSLSELCELRGVRRSEAVKQFHLPVKTALFPSYFTLPLRLHSRVWSPRQAEKGWKNHRFFFGRANYFTTSTRRPEFLVTLNCEKPGRRRAPHSTELAIARSRNFILFLILQGQWFLRAPSSACELYEVREHHPLVNLNYRLRGGFLEVLQAPVAEVPTVSLQMQHV